MAYQIQAINCVCLTIKSYCVPLLLVLLLALQHGIAITVIIYEKTCFKCGKLDHFKCPEDSPTPIFRKCTIHADLCKTKKIIIAY